MHVRLAPGVGADRAIAEMKQIAGNTSTAIRPNSRHPVDQRDDYVRWATTTEAQLRSLLQSADARSFFEDARHRDICSMPPGNQLTPLIYDDLRAKTQDLNEAVAYLEGLRDRMRRAPGLPIVVDSNVLLQWHRPDHVNWAALVKISARVMLPLRVIEEIDAKKYSGNARLRTRARNVLPWINGLFPEGDTGPVPLRPDATIELILEDRPRHRPDDADEEILDVSHRVVQFAGSGKLMTGDTAMRVRAMTEGLEVLFVSEDQTGRWLDRQIDAE